MSMASPASKKTGASIESERSVRAVAPTSRFMHAAGLGCTGSSVPLVRWASAMLRSEVKLRP